MGKASKKKPHLNETQNQFDLERYKRQMLLKEWNQEKLQKSSVFIAGVGALGTIIALNLSMMGVGHLILCDFDTIEVSNLARQVLFENSDVGRSKVVTAKKALERINPTITITALDQNLKTVERKFFEECDVVADGLDTFEARRWLNSLCITLKKPLVHGGMFGWTGNVQVIIPFKTACLECHPLIPQERLQKPCTPPGEARKDEGSQIQEEEKIPTIATVATIIAGIQSQEIIKLLLGSDKILDGFLFYDGHSEAFTKVPLVQNPNCIICGKYRIEGINFAIDLNETIRELKNRVIMTWGLEEPLKMVIKGVIQQDDVTLAGLRIKEKEPIFVWDNLPQTKPLKLYAIIKEKITSPAIGILPKTKKPAMHHPAWSDMHELEVEAGQVMYHKKKLSIKAMDTGEVIKFFKTLPRSKTKRIIRFKLKASNNKKGVI
ncbi:MAG: HesA/MoeB/ThiF family protein [Candidatus Helarchaeota archaeon]